MSHTLRSLKHVLLADSQYRNLGILIRTYLVNSYIMIMLTSIFTLLLTEW